MIIINRSPLYDSEGKLLESQVDDARLMLGESWEQFLHREAEVVRIMGERLDDRFTLVRHIGKERTSVLPDQQRNTPDLLLIGPTGIWSVLLSHVRGDYKIDGDRWYRYDPSVTDYVEQENTLAEQARVLASNLMDRLQAEELPPWVHPLVVLTNPNAKTDLNEPAVITVTVEQVGRFTDLEIESRLSVMSGYEVTQVLESLSATQINRLTDFESKYGGETTGIPARPVQTAELTYPGSDEKRPQRARSSGKGRRLGMTPLQCGCISLLGLLMFLILGFFGLYMLNDLYPELLAQYLPFF